MLYKAFVLFVGVINFVSVFHDLSNPKATMGGMVFSFVMGSAMVFILLNPKLTDAK